MEVEHIVKIEIPAQSATPAPPLGPKVGQYGINIRNLCTEFNEATKNIEAQAPVPIVLTIFKNKSFSFQIKSLPTAYLIKKYAQNGELSKTDALKIISEKRAALTSYSEEASLRTIAGTAKSMGIKIIDAKQN